MPTPISNHKKSSSSILCVTVYASGKGYGKTVHTCMCGLLRVVASLKFHKRKNAVTGFIQARLCKIQGLLEEFPTVLVLFARAENLRKILIYIKILLWKY